MSPPFELRMAVLNQAHPCFMDQGGRLQGVTLSFLRHLIGSDAAQFVVDQRQQLIGSAEVAPLHRLENPSDVAHGWVNIPKRVVECQPSSVYKVLDRYCMAVIIQSKTTVMFKPLHL